MQTMQSARTRRADGPRGRNTWAAKFRSGLLHRAEPVPADIEMDVVAMLGVAVGGQHDREITAGPARKTMQEQALRSALAPIVLDADSGAVGQAKPGDVDRPAQGVLAEVAAA